MSSPEHEPFAALPEPPSPAPSAREAAIERALGQFDGKHGAASQGFAHRLRLRRRTAILPSPGRFAMPRFAMPRTRSLVAASLVVLLAGSAVWLSNPDLFVRHQLFAPTSLPGTVPTAPPPAAPQITTAYVPFQRDLRLAQEGTGARGRIGGRVEALVRPSV